MSFHVRWSALHVRSEPCLKYTPEEKAGSNSGSNFAQMLSLRSILGGPPPHDVPTSLSLCGELKHKTECLGTYLPAPQRTAHGKPVWKHASADRWIACISTGIWKVQEGVDVGVKDAGFMKLEDITASLPHQSTAVWEEYHGTAKQWVKAPTCKCFGDVPTSLSLCGELKHKTECLGTYLLAPQRTVYGKPVWKHATADRWIACISTGIWKVQEGVDVGVKDAGFMKLEDTTASLPHQSTTVWEEYHGKEWLKAPTCKVDGGGPPPVHDEGPPVALGTDEYAFICHDGRLMYMSTSPTTRC